MAKAASQARQSRVNIEIREDLRGGSQPELPLRVLVAGDYTMQEVDTPIAERKPWEIRSPGDFDSVLKKAQPLLDLTVPDPSGDEEVSVSLEFSSLKDFHPGAVARQVPHLRKLLEVREAIKALRPTMGDKKAVQQLLEAVKRPEDCQAILSLLTPASNDQTDASVGGAASGEGESSEAQPGSDTPEGAP